MPRIDHSGPREQRDAPPKLTFHEQARGRRRGRGGRYPPAKAHERLQARGASAAEAALRCLVLLSRERPPGVGGSGAAATGSRGERERTAPDAAAAAASAEAAPGARGEVGAEATATLREGGGGVAGGDAGRGEGARGQLHAGQGPVLALRSFQVRQHRHKRVPHVVHGPKKRYDETTRCHFQRHADGQGAAGCGRVCKKKYQYYCLGSIALRASWSRGRYASASTRHVWGA